MMLILEVMSKHHDTRRRLFGGGHMFNKVMIKSCKVMAPVQ